MRFNEFIEKLPALINKTADVDGIQVSINTNAQNATAYASSQGKRLGYVEFDRDGNVLVPYDLAVDDKYRGQGIAAVMYDYVKSLGFKIQASADQTDDGKYFWKKNRGSERVWEDDQDYIAGYCHVMALALKKLHPDWKIRAHIGWDEQAEDDNDYRVDHVYAVAPDGSAYDCRGRFDSEEQLVGPDETGGVETQYVDMNFGNIKQLIQRGELKSFTMQDIEKATQLVKQKQSIKEIARIPQGDFGDADTLTLPKYDVEKKELPGGSKFTYGVGKPNAEDLEIMIFDGDTLAAELDLFHTRDVTGAWRVETVAVNPEYRSKGLGKALYGIALSILRLTLEAGDTQTKHGQRMWLMLNSIPGVEVIGYNMERTSQYKPNPNDEIIAQDDTWTRYLFPVKPGTHSMRSGRRGTGMYTSQASMIAKWTGK
jgi:GNAT superfamily N-acetyltransferase